MRVLVTRPREDGEKLAHILRARGIEVLLEPLLSVEYLDGPGLDLSGVQALVVTSANGLRAFTRRDDRRGLPVFAVGDASAEAAAEAGFPRVISAAGDIKALAGLIGEQVDPAKGALLHVSGTAVAGDLGGVLAAAGLTCRRQALYRAKKAQSLSAAAVQALRAGTVDGVLLFSPKTATTFVVLSRQAGLEDDLRGITAFCLSPAVAETVRTLAWLHILVASRPDQDAMLEVMESHRALIDNGGG
ncbi:MAG: uroporphyrinogen-III synthase [Rhodospirillales bacterium]|jgi:uroporphyrinogen-III synthase|nr:uroporphyrinogen-III synthase [Rhodospirillales bacterium]HJN23467.1 uroporphyrinogen-III synthase [Rhodospirillales bacterium]